MRATCPSCGAKDRHEKIFSVVRTWFRCNRCSYVWRGSFWAFLYEGSPLGSRRDQEAAIVPTATSLEPPTPLDAAQLETELTVVEDALEHPAPTDRDQPLPLPPSSGPAVPATSSTPQPLSPASPIERQDVTDWLDGVEGAIAPPQPAPETADMQRDLENVPKAPPQKPAATDVPERRPDTPAVSAGRTDSLDETLRRLEVFDAELTLAKQRLSSTEHAYSALVKRWKPAITDRGGRRGGRDRAALTQT